MNRVGIYRSSVIVEVVNYVGLPLLAIYLFSMFMYPWIAEGGNWRRVQGIWDSWQTLNAGALAFLASLVALNISRYNENRQRERDFIAAKAFLPSTLSGLVDYFASSARIHESLWTDNIAEASERFAQLTHPSDYRDVLANCIRHADPSVGSYLSNILVRLQVHDARLKSAVATSAEGQHRFVGKPNLITYLFRVGELYALIGNLFGFARGEDSFHEGSLTWENFRAAYRLLDLEIDDFVIDETMTLEGFTKRQIDRADARPVESER